MSSSSDLLILFFGFLFGVSLGSFVKVLADRSLEQTTLLGRSECNFCHKTLAWYDLLPLISYITLKGKCRYCNKRLSKEYFLVEAGMGVLVALIFFQSSLFLSFPTDYWRLVVDVFDLIFKIFIVIILVSTALTDLKKTLIPDRITYPAIAIAFVSLLLITIYKIGWLYNSLSSTLLGKYLLPPTSDYFTRHVMYTLEPFFGSVIMGLVIGLFFLILILVTRGRGMGGGDLKLGIFLGLAFGFPNSILVLMLAFLLGSVVGIILIIFGKKKLGQTIPFGPFLSLGGIITLFVGSQIIGWYLKLRF